MSHWAFMADPESYGWKELERDGSTAWDGVANATAQRHLRACRPDDQVLIYHTAPDKAVIGIARVTSEPRPDPADAKRVVVEVSPVRPLARPLPLAELRADATLQHLGFVRMPRVAVQPVSDPQWRRVLELSGTR
ncbi:MAG TPA: EVE domain-containing protein [Longimicrobiales bacterium]|nr:EVE domain-containing protein [Longimicrobiales bacterium]